MQKVLIISYLFRSKRKTETKGFFLIFRKALGNQKFSFFSKELVLMRNYCLDFSNAHWAMIEFLTNVMWIKDQQILAKLFWSKLKTVREWKSIRSLVFPIAVKKENQKQQQQQQQTFDIWYIFIKMSLLTFIRFLAI